MDTKPYLQSKTLIAAVVVGALAGLNEWSSTITDASVLNYALLGTALLNVVFRFVTDKPVA